MLKSQQKGTTTHGAAHFTTHLAIKNNQLQHLYKQMQCHPKLFQNFFYFKFFKTLYNFQNFHNYSIQMASTTNKENNTTH